MTTRYTVRGSHVCQAARWVDDHLEAGAFVRLARELDPDWPEHFELRGAYVVGPMIHALEAASERVGIEFEEAATEVAVANAREDLSTIYRAFVWVAGPVMLLNSVPRLWSLYVDFAGARALTNVRGHFTGEGYGLPDELLVWAAGAWQGFLPAAIEMAGGKNARATITKRGAGPGPEPGSHLHCEITYD